MTSLLLSVSAESNHGLCLCVPTQITTAAATLGSFGRRQLAGLTRIRCCRLPLTRSWTSARWSPWRPTAAGTRAARTPLCTCEWWHISADSALPQKQRPWEASRLDVVVLQKAFFTFTFLVLLLFSLILLLFLGCFILSHTCVMHLSLRHHWMFLIFCLVLFFYVCVWNLYRLCSRSNTFAPLTVPPPPLLLSGFTYLARWAFCLLNLPQTEKMMHRAASLLWVIILK